MDSKHCHSDASNAELRAAVTAVTERFSRGVGGTLYLPWPKRTSPNEYGRVWRDSVSVTQKGGCIRHNIIFSHGISTGIPKTYNGRKGKTVIFMYFIWEEPTIRKEWRNSGRNRRPPNWRVSATRFRLSLGSRLPTVQTEVPRMLNCQDEIIPTRKCP